MLFFFSSASLQFSINKTSVHLNYSSGFTIHSNNSILRHEEDSVLLRRKQSTFMPIVTRSQSSITNGMPSHYPVSCQDDGYNEMPSKYPWSLGGVGGEEICHKLTFYTLAHPRKMGCHDAYKYSTSFAGYLPCFYKPFLPVKPRSMWESRYKII